MSNFRTPQQPVATPGQALRVARIIWAALLMGPIGFACVVVYLFKTNPQYQGPPPQGTEVFFPVSLAMLAVTVPAGLVFRWIMFRKRGPDGTLPPQSFISGTIISLSCCEGVSFFGLIDVMLSHTFWPAILPTLIATAVQLVSFPTGKAMEPPIFPGQRVT